MGKVMKSIELSELDKSAFETVLTGLKELILICTEDQDTADEMIEQIMDILFIPEDDDHAKH